MEKGRADTEGGSALFVRPTVLDAGIGVLYFFTSHMVIRAMYSIGVDRTSTELSVFFLVVIASVIATICCRSRCCGRAGSRNRLWGYRRSA